MTADFVISGHGVWVCEGASDHKPEPERPLQRSGPEANVAQGLQPAHAKTQDVCTEPDREQAGQRIKHLKPTLRHRRQEPLLIPAGPVEAIEEGEAHHGRAEDPEYVAEAAFTSLRHSLVYRGGGRCADKGDCDDLADGLPPNPRS